MLIGASSMGSTVQRLAEYDRLQYEASHPCSLVSTLNTGRLDEQRCVRMVGAGWNGLRECAGAGAGLREGSDKRRPSCTTTPALSNICCPPSTTPLADAQIPHEDERFVRCRARAVSDGELVGEGGWTSVLNLIDAHSDTRQSQGNGSQHRGRGDGMDVGVCAEWGGCPIFRREAEWRRSCWRALRVDGKGGAFLLLEQGGKMEGIDDGRLVLEDVDFGGETSGEA
ncbi:hypothetical protein EDD18DRAFT_1098755 [Armillaria luteobubalina]|uniref:Uncharacterized protein n=1 Tax=Armillaria luteobubalina TaxID=153913 RepID=A0AA39QLZ0_9AGAR|nr:hypothetical protein EDD18DRAFT_1098755 [Armillaria luteobubalina]